MLTTSDHRFTVALVACSAQKLDRPAPARELYTSTLFRLARAWAEANAGPWYIISARYGLSTPYHWLAPYDQRLPKGSPERRARWAEDVAALVHQWLGSGWGLSPDQVEIVMLAGRDYCTPLADYLREDGYTVTEPLQGMGIGSQQAWLKANTPEKE